MSKGFLVIAQNTETVNYVDQAYALALSIKHSQETVTKISIVTNDPVPKKYLRTFDQVIPIPFYDETKYSTYRAENRWKLYYASPYFETIVLDTDMLVLEDISDWWKYCSNYDLQFCSKIKNYKLETVVDTFHRKMFIANKLTNPYFALHYFKKSEVAEQFYKSMEFVINNWEWCYTKFAPEEYQNWLSMDVVTAITIEMLGLQESVVDACSPLEFIHMKTPLQGWDTITDSWQNRVPVVLNKKGNLVVGNIKQDKIFHYVEKDFLKPALITRLEELAYDRI